ncbi:DUF3108 domain-containing protein [Colwellia sp. 75C3]|uniref:DUF3108 domain-containing protein n=1 Tax=Colwellia sp. 75C3 TaxID=888425 RepID=UPI001E36BD20|nr:DUF3108 domain-containing protein [Colwellia sp. 75C3]
MTKLTNRTKSNKLTIKRLFSLKVLTLLSFLFIACTDPLQAKVLNTFTAEEFSDLHQGDKIFEYNVYVMGKNVGYLHRTINWDNSEKVTKGTVTSYGEVTFLWLDLTYQQQSSMQYSPQYHHFLTSRFSQKLTGIKSREMTAELSDNGLSSTVTLNTEVSHYQQQSENENENQPLYDLDTLGAQIRLNLLQGKTRFPLSRQASSKIERY